MIDEPKFPSPISIVSRASTLLYAGMRCHVRVELFQTWKPFVDFCCQSIQLLVVYGYHNYGAEWK